MKIYPSLISSNVLELKHTITLLDEHCDGYHLDVMDDHFVPNLTWGPVFINAIAATTGLPVQVHLMVDNPVLWIDRLKLTSRDTFIFHIESVKDSLAAKDIIEKVREKDMNVGIALNPKTSVDAIKDIVPLVDKVLVMSVEPGFSGQAFIPEVMHKVEQLCAMRDLQRLSFLICMDGGVGYNNITQLAEAGVDIVAVASAIFSRKDIVCALKDLYSSN
ncbi:MAG: ribulose-phosphate 3-epimerase [bacterium]